MDITPYFASLIDPDDPNCPIRRQVIPTGKELMAFDGMFVDSLNEDAHSPVPGLVHRYPDRVLMLVTTQCASYCRYCTRSRIVGDPAAQFSRSDYDAQIDYIARTPQVRDVLLSGGDPLILPLRILEDLLRRLRAIEHVEIIRIGSRVPVFMPQRITAELVDMLRQFHPLWMNIHFNHAEEFTPEVEEAVARLADAGIPLGAQTVLLAGINDSVEVMKELVHKLVRNRVRPYYLYQCDLVEGAGHFRTTVSKGIEIIEGLRGHTSGYAIPTYVVDAPGGGGKIPVMPQYVISQAPGKVVLRNFEGFITTYNEPNDYTGHTVARPERRLRRACRAGRDHRAAVRPRGLHQAGRLRPRPPTAGERALGAVRGAARPIRACGGPCAASQRQRPEARLMALSVAVLANLKVNAPVRGDAGRCLGRPGFRHHGQRDRRGAGSARPPGHLPGGQPRWSRRLPQLKPDICFNICEGHWGD